MSSLNISVIIPAYNAEPYLAAAIESVLDQTAPAAEVIVVDDNSTDRTLELARSFARVNCIQRPAVAARGVGAARNHGIGIALGDWLTFLDADDLWLPRKLELQCAAAQQSRGVEIFFGGVEQFVSPELGRADELRLAPPVDTTAVPHAGTMLVHRKVFDRIGLFDDQLRMSEFIDWFARARDSGIVMQTLPEIFLRRRRHLTNTTIREKNHFSELALVMKRSLDRRRHAAATRL